MANDLWSLQSSTLWECFKPHWLFCLRVPQNPYGEISVFVYWKLDNTFYNCLKNIYIEQKSCLLNMFRQQFTVWMRKVNVWSNTPMGFNQYYTNLDIMLPVGSTKNNTGTFIIWNIVCRYKICIKVLEHFKFSNVISL